LTDEPAIRKGPSLLVPSFLPSKTGANRSGGEKGKKKPPAGRFRFLFVKRKKGGEPVGIGAGFSR